MGYLQDRDTILPNDHSEEKMTKTEEVSTGIQIKNLQSVSLTA